MVSDDVRCVVVSDDALCVWCMMTGFVWSLRACFVCVPQNTAETLRRQVKEEVHTRTVLQARINSDTQEMEKTRTESGKKKEKVQPGLNGTLSCYA